MWFEFLLKMLVIFALIFGVACATPHIAKIIDKRFKRKPVEKIDDGLNDIYDPND